MKRILALLAALCAALTLASCAIASQTQEPSNPILYYYRLAKENYGSENGVMGAERYDFGAKIPTLQEILDLYFSGPTDDKLVSPFPKGLRAESVSLDNGVLTVTLDDSFSSLSGISYTVAEACITKTMTQVNGVNSVCLETESQKQLEGSAQVTPMDFVCQELGTGDAETTVRLYFSDANGRYLVPEERKTIFSDATQIPSYVLQQLLAGPQEKQSLATIPEGTKLLSVSVDGGVCTVDFSSEFLLNKPTSELLERMTVFSIVDSLTELEQIQKVRILVEGKKVGQYLDMDLAEPLTRDESAVGVVRAGLNETDATLYVGCWKDGVLASVPVGVRKTSSETESEALLRQLVSFKARNGLTCPLPSGTSVQSVDESDGVCHVDFSESFLKCAGNEDEEKLAVRSVAATLATLDGVHAVRITVNAKSAGLRYMKLSETYTPDESWFFGN